MAFKVGELYGEISLRDSGFGKGLDDVDRRMGGLSSRLGGFAGTAGKFLGGAAVTGIGALGVGFGIAAKEAIDMNSVLETSTLQFETLMGDAERAEAHVASLFTFAKKTPFETGPIIEASKMMQTFGGEALNTNENLTLIGDAAAATGAGIDELGFWTGRLYSNLQAGKPFGEAAARLSELAVLSPQARMEMEEMQAAGASADEIFAAFQGNLGNFTGAMEKQSGTWSGLTSTFKDQLSILAAEGMRPLFDTAKNTLGRIVETLDTEAIGESVARFGEALAKGMEFMGDVVEAISAGWEWITGLFEGGGGEVSEEWLSIWENVKGILTAAWDIIRAVFDAAVAAVTFIWETFGENIVTQFRNAWAFVKTILDAAFTVLRGVFDVFAGLFTGDWKRMGEGLKSIWRGLWKAITGVFRYAWETLKNLGSMFLKFFGDIPGKIVDAFSGAKDLLRNIGKSIIDGLIRGIREKWDDLKAGLRKIGDKIKEWKGPESYDRKLLTPAGAWIMEGLVDGIDSRTDELRRKLQSVSGIVSGVGEGMTFSGPPTGSSGSIAGRPIVIRLDGRTIWEGVMPYAVDDVATETGRRF